MATRRVESGGETLRFDHGAQYFTARDPAFREAVAAWEQAGVAARWPAAGEEAWVGTPGMNACVRAMAEGLDLRWSTRAARLRRSGALWEVEADEGPRLAAATVLVAVPAEQAAVLLGDPAPDFAARAARVVSAPCWAVMAAFAAPLSAPDTFRSDTGPIGWAARNSAKPGRGGGEAWVIHASAERSRELVDRSKEEVARSVLADFFAATGIAPETPTHLDSHRWLYALPEARPGEAPVFDADLQIGIAGDWLHSPRVEGAWLSGRVLAQAVRAA
jgi:predicted NAD/FAD-dependent oxidoreductase